MHFKCFKVTSIGRGFYCLRFKSKEDQNRAWLYGSINLNPGSFMLQPWSKDFNPARQKQTTYHVWIRLHEITQEYWDPQFVIWWEIVELFKKFKKSPKLHTLMPTFLLLKSLSLCETKNMQIFQQKLPPQSANKSTVTIYTPRRMISHINLHILPYYPLIIFKLHSL